MIYLIILLLRRVLTYNYASLLKHRFILTNYFNRSNELFPSQSETFKVECNRH